MKIVVFGTPAPQGSKKFVGRGGGFGQLVESSKKVKPWRQDVKAAAIEAMNGAGNGIIGPVRAKMIFTMPKPKSAPKRRKSWPDRKPDLSKLVRSTEDALSEAGVWEDDARVVNYTSLRKVFPGEGSDSLAVPGVVIYIEEEKE
jgi:Holliday junction resolvase RusA-like endonuclease